MVRVIRQTTRYVSLLESVPLFAALPPADLQVLAGQLMQRAFRRNEVIFHRDDPGTALYIIQEGQVKISLPNMEGDEVTLDVVSRGNFFGEMSLIDGLPRSATATSIVQTRVLSLSRDHFRAMLDNDWHATLNLMGVLGRRLRHTNEMIEDIVTLDIPGRLAKKLIDLADTKGMETGEGVEVQLRLTQQDLASMIGATRESTNKVLRGFILKGWVTIDAHHIVVRRADELRRRIY